MHALTTPPQVDTITADMVPTSAAVLAELWPGLFDLGLGFDMVGEHASTPEESRRTLGRVIRLCDSLRWADISGQAARLLRRAEAGESGPAMMALAEDLREALEQKYERTQVCIVEGDDFKLFKSAAKHLCGNAVIDKLPSSAEELDLAGRCLSLGLSTASVSHSMRAVEASLHVLAKETGVTFSSSVELQDWVNLTEKINSEIKKRANDARSPEKTNRLKRLAELLIPADGFRLAWRNHVAHAREKYEESDARTVIGHVSGYLKELASAL